MKALVAFNDNCAILPESVATQLRLPVQSEGLREIIADRFKDISWLEDNATAAEKNLTLRQAYGRLQTILYSIEYYGRDYFPRGIPADLACAACMALTGDEPAQNWKHIDARKGSAILQNLEFIAERAQRDHDFRRETSRDIRKLLFVRGLQLAQNLEGHIAELAMEFRDQRLQPKHYDCYNDVFLAFWPKSSLTADNMVLARRFANLCSTVTSPDAATRLVRS